MREQLWKFLMNRSAAYRYWMPSRSNTLMSIVLLCVTLPLALVFVPFSIFRFLVGRKTNLYELRVQEEFGWLVDLLERVRKLQENEDQSCMVFVRASFKHKGLAHLYGEQAGCRIMWSYGLSVVLTQVVLWQPLFTQQRRLLFADNVSQFSMCEQALSPTRKLVTERRRLLHSHGISTEKYVTMAVFTSTCEETKDPDYRTKYQPRETTGTELSAGVDYLRSQGIDVVMLGFADSGKSHVPREMLRLSNLGAIGGHQEVALASGCEYFWSDFVGAQWLREPFKKPVLVTNHDEACFARWMNFSDSFRNRFIIVPVRFQTRTGHLLSFREALSMRQCFHLVGEGKLFAIRNSPTEIIEAHEEMVRRLDGTWKDGAQTLSLHQRVSEIYSGFPEYYVPRYPSTFLKRHEYLLD